MFKRLVIILGIFILLANIVGQEIRLSSDYSGGETPEYLKVNGNQIEFNSYSKGKEFKVIGNYSINEAYKIPFLEISNDKKYLFLNSKDFVFIQNTSNNECVFLTANLGKGIEAIQKPYILKASSFLTEGKNKYSPENLKKKTFSGNPFVPSRLEGWKKCSLQLIWKEYSLGSKNYLIISNGFVSTNKPYLYTQNSRAKDIIVTLDSKNIKYKFHLDDTPNPQILRFPETFQSVEIVFSSVYLGEKWDDLCLNFIQAGSVEANFNFYYQQTAK